MRCFQRQPHFRFLRLQVSLEIALSGVSAKVKLPQPAFSAGQRCVETSDHVIKSFLRDSGTLSSDFPPADPP
jgi:hypothetical protein